MRPSPLYPLDVGEQHFLVPFRVHLFVYLANHALGIDYEGGALPELHPLPFRLADAERLHERGVGVGEQVDSKGELVGEIPVRGDIVGANPNNFKSRRRRNRPW